MKQFGANSKRMLLANYITLILSVRFKTVCLGVLIIILTWIDYGYSPMSIQGIYEFQRLILKRHINADVSALIKDLRDKDWNVRFSSLQALIERGPEAKAAIQSLIEVFKDKNENNIIRLEAATALHRMKPESKIAIPAFIEVIKDKRENEGIRSTAVKSLEEMKPYSRNLFPDLIMVFKDKNEPNHMRYITAKVLKEIGPKDETLVSDLIEIFKDKDEDLDFRTNAAEILREIGPKAKAAVLDLIEVLKDKKEKGEIFRDDGDRNKSGGLSLEAKSGPRSLAAFILGEIGPSAKDALPALIEIFKDKNEINVVRMASASALGKIEGKMALLDLLKVLKDKSEGMIRNGVASALGEIGPAAKAIIPTLIEILNDENEDKILRETTGMSLLKIAEKLQDTEDTESIPDLEKALNAFVTGGIKENAEKLSRSIHALKAIKRAKMWNSERDWIYQNRWMFGPLIFIILALSFSFVLLLLRPLWLLRINDALKPYTDFKLPDWLGGIKIPIRYILLLGFFDYHKRVLDAWVAQHIELAQKAFQSRPTVKDRSVHVPVPVVFDGKSIANMTIEHLRSTFSRGRGVLLISGEGGAGKTSLACQVAKWGMSEDNATRLSKDHLMLPVLIEYDLDSEEIHDKDAFSKEIRGQIIAQIGEEYPISEDLVYHLLIRRRILVILDGLSELSKATRNALRPADPNFPINALIITSRIDEKLDGVPKATIKPLRIHGNRLSTFMEAYFVQLGKRELFDDTEYFDACRRLSSIVGLREITPLFAKIYADQLISFKEGRPGQELPDNIPDLVLNYLNELNRGASADDPDDRTVHRAAKTIAWECQKNTYRPTPARRPIILAALGGNDNPEVILNYLENRLRLVQTIGSGRDQIKFTLDPLAEYLAGLYLVDHYGEKTELWHEFFAHTDKLSGGPELTKGFFLAVKDCCMAKGNETKFPSFVLDELTSRINLDEE